MASDVVSECIDNGMCYGQNRYNSVASEGLGDSMKEVDVIVAGAGIWGCTVARRLAEAGRKVLVLEKRKAVGGNCRCRTIDGIEVHLYGSHIFHTSNEEVWKFVTRFAAFNDYRHMVLANYKGKIYHLPIGCTLLKEFFGRDLKPSELNEDDRKALFDAFVRGYTSKQWGVPPEKVDPSIIARLKVRETFSTDYFDDPHQGIPLEGYNKLFRNMLDHPNITVKCNSAFELPTGALPGPVYYSGPIDQLFNYRFGALPWRSLRFETEHVERLDYQGATVVNYTDAAVPYTRIHEFRHYHPEAKGAFAKPKGTIITREYPADWQKGDEPYYPINTPESAALLARYQEEVESFNSSLKTQNSKLVIDGRLGGYKYYDMDKSIAMALKVMEER